MTLYVYRPYIGMKVGIYGLRGIYLVKGRNKDGEWIIEHTKNKRNYIIENEKRAQSAFIIKGKGNYLYSISKLKTTLLKKENR